MTSIVVTAEQAELIKNSAKGVEVRSPQGEWLGVVKNHGWTNEDIQVAKQRLATPGPRYTTAEVLAYLQSPDSDH